MTRASLPARWRTLFAAGLLVVGAVFSATPASAAPSQAPPPIELPPPPVTVQDLVNELLPLIRQLQPITNQIGPIVAQLDPLVAQGAAFSEQLGALTTQLEPFIAQVAPLAQAAGSALQPLWESVDAEITPQLQALLALFGPYINQVDLATGFQVIGPLAPTAVKTIPTLNKFYDSIDVIAPLRDPITCPLARAVPQQNLLDIVVPFLCYDTIGPAGPINAGTPIAPTRPSSEVSGDTGETPPPPTPAASTGRAAPPAVASPAAAGGSRTSAGAAPSAGTRPAASPVQAIGATSDDRVEALEARLRLMMVLAGGIGLLLWNFFRQGSDDGSGGLGAFRRARSSLPPPLA